MANLLGRIGRISKDAKMEIMMNMPRSRNPIYLFIFALLTSLAVLWQSASAQTNSTIDCINGEVAIALSAFPCLNVGFESAIPTNIIGLAPSTGADIWGWTDDMDTPNDPSDDREYAIIANANHTAFVDVTNPAVPDYVASLPVPGNLENALWRDVKTMHNYALMVGDFNVINTHGVQIFDLKTLEGHRNDGLPMVPVILDATVDSFSYFGTEEEPLDTVHNIVTNEESNMAYAVAAAPACDGGLHAIDMTDPTNPVFAGCYDTPGYNVHDSLCVVYDGPDTAHQGKEICFNSSEDLYEIVDMTDPQNPVLLSSTIPPTLAYAHQGWLTEDQAYFVTGDELDELNLEVANTTTYIFDVRDLDDIRLINAWKHNTLSTDHNLYIKDGLAYLANYTAGLRILDLSAVAAGQLTEVGYFDVEPARDEPATSGGLWSVYPYFESGTIVVNDLVKGLMVLRPTLPNFAIEQSVTTSQLVPQPNDVVNYETTLTNTGTVDATDMVVTIDINDVVYTMTGPEEIAVGESATYTFDYTIFFFNCNELRAKSRAESGQGVKRQVDVPLRTPICVEQVPLAVGLNNATTTTAVPILLAGLMLLGVTGIVFGRKLTNR